MRIFDGKAYRDLTEEELAAMRAQTEEAEKEYWTSISYDEAVNAEIRKCYTESQEFSILRQRDEKPEEFAVYYAYCEACKANIKAQLAKYSQEETV